MSIVANLDVNLRASTAGLDKGFKSAEKAALDFGKKELDTFKASTKSLEVSSKERQGKLVKAADTLGTVTKAAIEGTASGSLTGVTSSLSTIATTATKMIGGPVGVAIVGAVAGVGLAVAGIVEQIAQKISGALAGLAQTAVTSKVLGVLPAELAALNHAAEMTGLGRIDGQLKAFNKSMAEAAVGTGGALLPLRLLNIRNKELLDLPLESKLGLIADRLNGLTNAGDKARVADMLGLGELMPMLEQGSAGLAKFHAQSNALGGGQGAQAALESTRAWNAFNASITALWNSLATMLAPVVKEVGTYVQALATRIAAFAAENASFFSVAIQTAFQLAAAFTEIQMEVTRWLSGWALADMAVANSGVTWEGFRNTAMRALFGLQYAIGNLREFWTTAMDFLALKAVQFGNDVVNVFTRVIPAAIQALGTAIEKIASGDSWAEAFRGIGEAAKKAMKRPETEMEQRLRERLEKSGKGMQEFIDAKMEEVNRKSGLGLTKPGESNLNPLPRKVAAMEAGSKEAFSVLYGTEDRQAKALSIANMQLKEMREQNQKLQELIRKRGIRLQMARL